MGVSDKTVGRSERLQCDSDGQMIGTLIYSGNGNPHLILEPGFMLVKMEETGRIRIWDSKKRKLVEFAK